MPIMVPIAEFDGHYKTELLYRHSSSEMDLQTVSFLPSVLLMGGPRFTGISYGKYLKVMPLILVRIILAFLH